VVKLGSGVIDHIGVMTIGYHDIPVGQQWALSDASRALVNAPAGREDNMVKRIPRSPIVPRPSKDHHPGILGYPLGDTPGNIDARQSLTRPRRPRVMVQP
jgi:hypothetical protein